MKNSTPVTPVTSLASLKRRAKQLGRQMGIQHTEALDRTAQAAGFHNYIHASRVLPEKTPTAQDGALYPLTISTNWNQRGVGEFGAGMESLTINLSKPWSAVLPPQKLGCYDNRHLRRLLPMTNTTDHLRVDGYYMPESQESARLLIAAAARSFVFMDATGLQPLATRRGWTKAFPSPSELRKKRVFMPEHDCQRFPGQDHPSFWTDPATGGFLIANEPYMHNPAMDGFEGERLAACEAWCEKVGFVMAAPQWGGMYNPYGGTRLFLLSRREGPRSIPLAPLVQILDRMPPPASDIAWQGESVIRERGVSRNPAPATGRLS